MAIASIFLGLILALVVIWVEPSHMEELLTKVAWTLTAVFLASTLLMAFASATPRDPNAGRHHSFRLTTGAEPPGGEREEG